MTIERVANTGQLCAIYCSQPVNFTFKLTLTSFFANDVKSSKKFNIPWSHKCVSYCFNYLWEETVSDSGWNTREIHLTMKNGCYFWAITAETWEIIPFIHSFAGEFHVLTSTASYRSLFERLRENSWCHYQSNHPKKGNHKPHPVLHLTVRENSWRRGSYNWEG